MNNILLTGAGGFVGKQILFYLDSLNYKVTVISSKNSKYFSKFSCIKKIIHTKNFFHEDEDWLCKSLNDIDTVIHLAWYAIPNDYLDSFENIDCLKGTLNFAKAFCKSKSKRFIGIGSCAEYGNYEKPLKSTAPLNPLSLYASCKSSAFYSLSSMIESTNKSFAWCRLFYLFGEGQSSQKLHGYIEERINKNLLVELSSGEQKKDFLDVKIAAKEIVEVALSNFEGPFNVCSGEGKTVKDIAQSIAKIKGAEHLLRFGAKKSSGLDEQDIVGVKDFVNNKEKIKF